MAVAASRGRSELQRRWRERENPISPERTIIWSEPSNNKLKSNTNITTTTTNNNNKNKNNVEQVKTVVPVVYYLSRNGQLEHPHFMEVTLSSPDGLFLRDVINRLNLLRGKGMASQYSWSSKRSYKNGYVWHDLEENDFIHPVHGGEYVLKGSEILEPVSSPASKSPETSSSSSKTTTGDSDFPPRRRRNQSWGALDEYKVYKPESTREESKSAATQTDDKAKRRRKPDAQAKAEEQQQRSTEPCKDEIELTPPPSDSSPETLESLMKADGRLVLASNSSDRPSEENLNRTVGGCSSGRMKASSVLMSLLSCGSISFRECGATTVREHGMSLVSQYRNRLTCGGGDGDGDGDGDRTAERKDELDDAMAEIESHASSSFAKMALEDKEYFSGSLIETNKDDFPALKRSSSYNADRNSHLKVGEKEEGARAKCIPRRAKTTTTQSSSKKECKAEMSGVNSNMQVAATNTEGHH